VKRWMKAARELLRQGKIGAGDLVLFEALAWGCQRDGGRFCISLNGLARLTGSCKQAVVDRLARLEGLGLVRRFKHCRLVHWANGGSAWRQMPNSYAIDCESTKQAVNQVEVRKKEAHEQRGRVPPAPPQPSVVSWSENLLERARRLFEARQRAASG
jgi:hypothetical protein